MANHIRPALLAETVSWPTNWLEGLDTNQRFSLLVVCIVFGAGIIIASVAILGGIGSTIHRLRLEADMKRELLDRGLSSEEVARIIEASGSRSPNRPSSCDGNKTGRA
jgi:hypothetical protein